MSRAATRCTATLLLVLSAALLAGCGEDDGAGGRRPLAGFGEVGFVIEGGSTAERCALAAGTPEARARGLMGQDDLRGYDGMLFRFDQPSTPAFYMYRTTLPLSIAWFDAAGRFVSSADMAPCPADDPAECPRYPPGAAVTAALEVPSGGLAELGIGPGVTLVVDDDGC